MIRCPYCGGKAKLQSGAKVYGPGYRHIKLLVCENYPTCDAYVGCHKGTTKPVGTLADAILRELRKKAHAEFDPKWKNGHMTRTEAYRWLAGKLNMPVKDCHIGLMDKLMCMAAILACQGKPVSVQFAEDES